MATNIHIYDEDPAAALITQRGLQALIGTQVSVQVDSSPDAAWLACANLAVDLLIVDPSPRNIAANALVRAVRAYRPQIPVLVLTAYDSPGLRTRMRNLGVDHYVAKPVDLNDLMPVVHDALHLDERSEPAEKLALSGSNGASTASA
jgi:two-component system OmpR family response regulator